MKLLCPPLENTVQCMDALELMRLLPSASVDAIITDLPYGTTACSWDEIIPFAPMWAGVKRILKPRGVFATTASQPFTSKLVCSNLAWFKYTLVWNKRFAGNFNLSEQQPMRTHEDICIFGKSNSFYYPQMVMRSTPIKGGGFTASRSIKQKTIVPLHKEYTEKFPESILDYPRDLGVSGNHPTQKPVDLYSYLIRTYTQPGDLVLDFCAGSGTTAVAARQLNRRYIVGDSSPEYCALMEKRLSMPYTPNMFETALFQNDKIYQLSEAVP